MSESKPKKAKTNDNNDLKKDVHVLTGDFYGALKSKHEIYFQMASLFKEVTRDEDRLTVEWIDRILPHISQDSTGNFFVNGI